MEKDVDAYVTMWADIPGKKNGLCFTGALAAAPTSGNFLVRAWHKGTYALSGRVYMEQGVLYPGVCAHCSTRTCTQSWLLDVHHY